MVPRGRALGPTGGFQIVTAGTSHSKAQRAAGTSRDVAPLLTLAGQPLLVLTHDPAFFATFKRVADPAHELRVVRSETDLASALMALHAGVVVLDTTSLTTPTGEVARQLEAQFPDVVLIVAGAVVCGRGMAAPPRRAGGPRHQHLRSARPRPEGSEVVAAARAPRHCRRCGMVRRGSPPHPAPHDDTGSPAPRRLRRPGRARSRSRRRVRGAREPP